MDSCPFTGKPCPHQKVTHVTDVNADGSFTEMHLCGECEGKVRDPVAAKPGLTTPMKSAIAEVVGQLFGLLLNPVAPPSPVNKSKKPPCPSCGISIEEIARDGRMGCRVCYEHFLTELRIITADSQGSAGGHQGKIPKDRQKRVEEADATVEDRVRSYKLKMVKAIEVENYEAAGDLKKLIESLQRQSPADSTTADSESPTPRISEDL